MIPRIKYRSYDDHWYNNCPLGYKVMEAVCPDCKNRIYCISQVVDDRETIDVVVTTTGGEKYDRYMNGLFHSIIDTNENINFHALCFRGEEPNCRYDVQVHYVDDYLTPEIKKTLYMPDAEIKRTDILAARMLIPEMFPNGCIFLDLDMLVTGNLHELWNQVTKPIGVVADNLSETPLFGKARYFNSGMMVLKRPVLDWNTMIEVLYNMGSWPDQSALNIIYGSWAGRLDAPIWVKQWLDKGVGVTDQRQFVDPTWNMYVLHIGYITHYVWDKGLVAPSPQRKMLWDHYMTEGI